MDLPSRLKRVFSKFFEFRLSGDFCDVEINIGHKTYHAHRLVLSAYSQYFQKMFLSGMVEGSRRCIQVNAISPEIFDNLLAFLYGKDLKIDVENAEGLIVGADMLQIEGAVEICAKFMKTQLDCSNCVGIFCFAKRHAFQDLQKTSWEYMLSHFYQLTSEEELLRCPFEVMDSLVKSEQIAILSESDVIHCVVKWLIYDVRKRRKHCVPLVRNVRSNLIPSHEMDKMLASINDLCLKIAIKLVIQNRIQQNKGTTARYQRDAVRIWEPRQSAKKSFYAVGGCVPKHSRRYTWEDSDLDVVSYVERFDSFGNSWDPYPISLREARTNLAVVSMARKIYAIGGEKDSMIYGSVECYDTLSRRWMWDMSPLNTPRSSCQAVGNDKEVYILGGYVGSGAGKSIERYDIEVNTCQLVNFAMQTERHSFGAVCFENIIYMAGGVGLSECELKTVECYDLSRHEWWFAKDMNFKRAYFSLVYFDGMIYAIGGHNEHHGTLKSMEAYDIYKNCWKMCSPMVHARAGAFIAVMDKKIVVVGGKARIEGHDGGTSWKVLHDAEVYDPVTMLWSACESMNFDPRCDGVAIVI